MCVSYYYYYYYCYYYYYYYYYHCYYYYYYYCYCYYYYYYYYCRRRTLRLISWSATPRPCSCSRFRKSQFVISHTSSGQNVAWELFSYCIVFVVFRSWLLLSFWFLFRRLMVSSFRRSAAPSQPFFGQSRGGHLGGPSSSELRGRAAPLPQHHYTNHTTPTTNNNDNDNDNTNNDNNH